MRDHRGEKGTRIAAIRVTTLSPHDEPTVALLPNERIVNVIPDREPDGVYLDVYVVADSARIGDVVPEDERDPACVERWPDCDDGLYDPRCCRFPKSCSARRVRPSGG